MNEQLLIELREFRTMLKGNYTDDQFNQMTDRMGELRKLHTPEVVYDAAIQVSSEQ